MYIFKDKKLIEQPNLQIDISNKNSTFSFMLSYGFSNSFSKI